MLDAWTWSPAPCRCELPAGPKSKNIVTVITHSKHSSIHFLVVSFPGLRHFSSFLTLCTRNLCDLISSCTHMSATSLCFSFPIPCLWRMCSVAFAPMFNTGFTAKPKSRIMLWTHSASDAPNAAACSSASALLFAMTFCFRVYAFMVCPPSIRTLALDDFRVSLRPAQSESVNTVSSSAFFLCANTCLHCLSRFRHMASLFNLSRLC